jgi:hypothetical protein
MTTRATSSYRSLSWDETPYLEQPDGPRLVRADIRREFTGDLAATSTAILLMCQAEGGTKAGYVGSDHFSGTLEGRTGTFVVHHAATMGDDRPHQSGYVVPGSGTGELKGIYGECSWIHEDREATFTLDYDFD